MYAPRRHSRRLLLPPGWVALGFLLLLGSQVLLAHRRQMQVPNILRLQMPMLEKIAAKIPYDPYIKGFAKPLSYVKLTTYWYTASLNGRKLNDFVNGALAATAVRRIDADSTHAAGIKICFESGATYRSLVSTLDLMNRTGQQSYWLDSEHQPTAVYAVNAQAIKHEEDELEKVSPSRMVTCYRMPVEEYHPSASLYSHWKKYQETLAGLWKQAWWPTTIFFVIISLLSLYRLRRLYRPSR